MKLKETETVKRSGMIRRVASIIHLAMPAGLVAAVLTLGGLPLAHAESARPHLEEIVVTVRRRAEMATDVPISITAMTPEMLENRGVTELSSLDTNVAGLNVTTGPSGANTPLIALRGQRPSEVLLTHDPAVPLYFAEVVLTPVYGTNLSMYDLSGVQVLKGPQGTLFGKNSTGGAVLFTPRAPETEFGGYMKGTLGDYNLYKFEGAVNLPVNDILGFRLAGQKTDRDGYQSIVEGPHTCSDCVGDEDSYGLRLVTSVDTAKVRNLTTLSYDENDSVAKSLVGKAFNPSSPLGTLWNIVHNGGLAALGGDSETKIDDYLARQNSRDGFHIGTDVPPAETIENRFFANNTEFYLNDELTIKNVFGYRYLEYDSNQDADGSPLPLFGSIAIDVDSVPEDVSTPSTRVVQAEQFSNEFQLIGSTEKLDWIAGLYWFKMEGSEDLLAQNVGPNLNYPETAPAGGIARYGLYQSSSETSVLNEAYAVFGEGTYSFNYEWSLTLGLRQTWDSREITSHYRTSDSANPMQPPSCGVEDENGNLLQASDELYDPSICSRTEDERFSSPTGRVALNYEPAFGELYYASISTGYRTGGFQTRAYNNATMEPYDEETVVTYELGHKADWNAEALGTLRTAVALYWQDYQDIQKTQGVRTDSGDYVITTFNAAEAVIRGVDLDVTWAPSANWLFTLSYAYIDPYYKEWERQLDADADGDGQLDVLDNESSPFVYIPEHSATATGQYTLPLDPALGDISLIASLYWQTKQDTYAEPQHIAYFSERDGGWTDAALQGARDEQHIDEYALWSFRVNWQGIMGSDFDGALYVNNAFDEEYENGGINAIESLGWAAVTYGPPRTVGASVQWNF